jgi:hypothetical protein
MARKTQTAWSKNPRTWVFWYEKNDNNGRIVIGTWEGKQPERSAIRKVQRNQYWNANGVARTGYTTELDCPLLVWPQSKLPMTNAMLDEINRIMEEDEAEDMAMYS